MASASTATAISHISVVTVHVTNQDEALRFYTDKLGFEKRMDAPMGEGMRWVTVAPAGALTEITLFNDSPDGGAPIGTQTGIVLECSDINAAYRELSGRGVTFTMEPALEPWGGWAEFTDQDGNKLGLHSAPSGQ